jgi:hypothetical protein
MNQRPDLHFEQVVDGSPHRAGLFVPGTGTPILSPDRLDADVTVITAWNYARDIRAQHPDYPGRWTQVWQ